MKVFGEKKLLGNKAINIINLYNHGFNLPHFFIIEKSMIKQFNIDLLNQGKTYIIRPSFDLEDGDKLSYAGFFKSLYPLKKDDVLNILTSKYIEKNFKGEKHILKSIIIQEFIDTNIYGVSFTRDPNNILQKGFFELSTKNDGVTSGNNTIENNLNFLLKLELHFIGNKLEKYFHAPQDIEFCIKDNKFILLQNRPITTGNLTLYNFIDIYKINGIYSILDFDELGKSQDMFSYKILTRMFNCIYLNSNIYFKSYFIPFYLIKNIHTGNENLNLFYKNYKKYLFKKILFNILKNITYQKIDQLVLKKLFIDYKYSFSLKYKSNLKLNFIHKTNFITNKFLSVEKQKNISFFYLEKYKGECNFSRYENENSINNLGKKLIFNKGIIQNNILSNEQYIWIHKGQIDGVIVSLKTLKYQKNIKQILVTEDIDGEFYDILDFISGVIIKNGNSLSHNSIILREFKIPSIIQYKEYDGLILGENIIL